VRDSLYPLFGVVRVEPPPQEGKGQDTAKKAPSKPKEDEGYRNLVKEMHY